MSNCKEYYQKNKEKISNRQKKYYIDNREKRLAIIKKHNDKRQIWIAQVMHNLKINGCAECGYDKCDGALSFHHANPEDKKYGIQQSFLKYGEGTIITELNKCILFCANCHRELHWRESHDN